MSVTCEWPEGLLPNTAKTFSGTWSWRRDGPVVLELPVTVLLRRHRPVFPDSFVEEKWVHLVTIEVRAPGAAPQR
jgi:hypothetical protein